MSAILAQAALVATSRRRRQQGDEVYTFRCMTGIEVMS
jgi:hypothetical protein